MRKLKFLSNMLVERAILRFLERKKCDKSDVWKGKLLKLEQLRSFGYYFGRGTIVVDGPNRKITMFVKTCFGNDWQDIVCIDTLARTWYCNDLNRTSLIEALNKNSDDED